MNKIIHIRSLTTVKYMGGKRAVPTDVLCLQLGNKGGRQRSFLLQQRY